MSKKAIPIELTQEERAELEATIRTRTAPQRSVQRAKIILLAAAGYSNTAIAEEMGLSRSQVVLWRGRFALLRLEGLLDRHRSGKPVRYGLQAQKRILALLDTPPPDGYTVWTAALVAKTLGDVSAAQVWRVLRQQGVHLQRRRSWCISTDPSLPRRRPTSSGSTWTRRRTPW